MFSEKHGNILHGILLIALFSCAAFYLADTQPARSLSFSPLILGILLGMLYANSLRNHLPETWVPGILFCSKQLLRAGIVLYGFRLTFQSVAAIGAPAIGIDAAVGRGDAPAGRIAGPCAENGPRPGAADLDGQRHLRRGGRAGRRTRREGRAAQDGGGGSRP